MLSASKLVAFIPTTDYVQARAFYEGVLGFAVLSEDQFALVVDAGANHVRITKVKFTPAQFTILGWEVSDIESAVQELERRGVQFERFSFFQQDSLGIWTAPSGDKVAWFKDPDGNILSVSRHKEQQS
jgi:catechol 2,3-dioxygenase-like lactoylglutathione lyase family enzyme